MLAIGKSTGSLKRRTIIKFTLPPSPNGATGAERANETVVFKQQRMGVSPRVWVL
ncbi:MAG: hypothetical protein ACREOO_32620 [bacterium]